MQENLSLITAVNVHLCAADAGHDGLGDTHQQKEWIKKPKEDLAFLHSQKRKWTEEQ